MALDTSRKLPLNPTYHTLGDPSFTTYALWEDATDTDLSAATGSANGEVLIVPDGISTMAVADQAVSYTGAVVDSNYYRAILGSACDGTPGTGTRVQYDNSATALGLFSISESRFGLYNIGVINPNDPNFSSGGVVITVGNTGNDHIKIVGCHSIGTTYDRGANHAYFIYSYYGDSIVLCNNLITGFVAGGTTDNGIMQHGGTDDKPQYTYNCAAYNSADHGGQATGIDGGTITAITMKNCAWFDSSTSNYITTSWGGEDSITQTTNKAEATNSLGLSDLDPSFEDSANDDYRIKSDDTILKGNGTNLDGSAPESESVYPHNDDITGLERVGNDVGPIAFATVGGIVLHPGMDGGMQELRGGMNG